MPMSKEAVEIVEVSPRDGFQSIREPIGTARKLAIIDALVKAGCRRIEAGSFVSPKAVPQMADMTEISAGITKAPDLRMMVLVPNLRGIELGLENGFGEFGYVFSVSEAHNQNNVRRSVSESLRDLEGLVALLADLPHSWRLRVNLATTFDCPFEGRQPASKALELIQAVQDRVPNAEIALCDTTGRANPRQVSELFEQALALSSATQTTWAYHGHDTFGLGVANALAAYQSGVRVFDSSVAGLGGCPFAPGATGNTATEDLVFAFEECGIETGINIERLLEVADTVASIPQACVASHLRHVPRERAVKG